MAHEPKDTEAGCEGCNIEIQLRTGDHMTSIKPMLNGNETVINRVVNNETVLNPFVSGNNGVLQPGIILKEKYRITEKLDVAAGEADLYLCQEGSCTYVVKLYKRTAAIKAGIVDALKTIDCPNIAKIIDLGTYKDYPYEIMPYYKEGSLSGKTFDLKKLKQDIIPCINRALNILHQNGIIHKDLKPSNIMSFNGGQDFALIDFGISTVIDDGNTLVQTRTGMTPEYSAPETFRGVYQLEDSDYYSFGITLYELYCGHTPYKNMSADEVAKYMAAQSLPFPSDMPAELKNLIIGLTYSDITHRKEKDNPNRRWGYEEVSKWNKGISLPIPGISKITSREMPVYTFLKQKYYAVPDLVKAFAQNWDDGKRQVFRGILSSFLKPIDPERADYCIDAEERLKKSPEEEDVIFWDLLYKMDESFSQFVWKNLYFDDLEEFGQSVLERLRGKKNDYETLWDEILESKLLSKYVSKKYETAEKIIAVEGLESGMRLLKYGQRTSDDRDKLSLYYKMGYLLSGDKTLVIDGAKYDRLEMLIDDMNTEIEKSFNGFMRICRRIMPEKDVLDPQFEAWLIALGKGHELNDWKKNLS